MKIIENPLVSLIEETIHLRDSAQNILSEAVGENSLSRLERLVLISLTEAERPLTASQIGRNLGHLRQVVQRAANRLLELQLIQKLPNPDHKTSPLLEPTAEGLNFERRMGSTLNDIVDKLLTEADIKACLKMCKDLKKIRAKIEAYSE